MAERMLEPMREPFREPLPEHLLDLSFNVGLGLQLSPESSEVFEEHLFQRTPDCLLAIEVAAVGRCHEYIEPTVVDSSASVSRMSVYHQDRLLFQIH